MDAPLSFGTRVLLSGLILLLLFVAAWVGERWDEWKGGDDDDDMELRL